MNKQPERSVEENEITKINKNYYRISIQPICSVFLDEDLMKKTNKILYRYQQEIDALLKNNPEHLIKEEWSLAYPNGEQKSFYGTDLRPVVNATEPKMITQKVENLYYIGNKNVYSDEVAEVIKNLMEIENE
jgi:hypothetical protein